MQLRLQTERPAARLIPPTSKHRNAFLLSLGLLLSLTLPAALAQTNGPACDNYTTKTTNDGLVSNTVQGVYAVGNTVYAATSGGLGISTDGGSSFTNKTKADGLGDNTMYGVYAVGNTVYVGTFGGLSISTNGGGSFTNKTKASNGLGSDFVYGLYVVGNTVYAGTFGGLSFCSTAVPPVVTGQPASASAVCAGASVTVPVAVTGATSYQWLKGSSPISGQTSATLTLTSVQLSDAGVYSLSATGAGGSVTSDDFTLTVNAAPTNASLSNNGPLTCNQTSVTLTATATGGTAYTLTGGASPQTNTTGQFVVSMAGTFTALISNASGCTATATTTVAGDVNPPGVSLFASSPTACAPTAITLTAKGSGTSYTFSAGATQIGQTSRAIVTQSGTYSVTTTATNGCTATANVSVVVNQPPTAPTLTNASRQVTVSSTPLPLTPFASATGSNTLSFSGVSGLFYHAPEADVSQPGVQSFSVSQTDANGCTSAATPFTITVVPAIPPTPGNQTVCRSSTVVLNAITTGIRYEWYKNGTTAPFKLTEIASIQKGTATSSLTVVSIQTSAPYYVKAYQANGTVTVNGPFRVNVNYGCIASGARVATAENVTTPEVRLSVTVAPNPVVAESLQAVVRGAGGSPLTADLVNLQGTVVQTQHWPVADDEQVIEWPVGGRSAGLYLLRAQSNGQVSTVKIVKQ